MSIGSRITHALEEWSKSPVKERAIMADYTSMGVGGPADVMWIPADADEASRAIGMCEKEGWSFEIVGAGTNLIIRDGGIEGLTILMRGTMDSIEIDGVTLRAGAGASLPRLAAAAAKAGLSGLEFAADIPGMLGGGMITNAGAFGASLGDTLESATLRLEGGQIEKWDNARLGFEYRSSAIPDEALILEGVFKLVASDETKIRKRMSEIAEKRKSGQPKGVKSSGCIFKNPTGDSAGRLIDSAGLKGKRIGGAMVSDVHGGYIVNTGGATATDVIALMDEIKRAIFETKGIDLMPEVKVIGRELNDR